MSPMGHRQNTLLDGVHTVLLRAGLHIVAEEGRAVITTCRLIIARRLTAAARKIIARIRRKASRKTLSIRRELLYTVERVDQSYASARTIGVELRLRQGVRNVSTLAALLSHMRAFR